MPGSSEPQPVPDAHSYWALLYQMTRRIQAKSETIRRERVSIASKLNSHSYSQTDKQTAMRSACEPAPRAEPLPRPAVPRAIGFEARTHNGQSDGDSIHARCNALLLTPPALLQITQRIQAPTTPQCAVPPVNCSHTLKHCDPVRRPFPVEVLEADEAVTPLPRAAAALPAPAVRIRPPPCWGNSQEQNQSVDTRTHQGQLCQNQTAYSIRTFTVIIHTASDTVGRQSTHTGP